MIRNRSRILAVVGVGVLLLLSGCGDSDDGAAVGTDEESLGFVGAVEGTDAFMSVLVADSDPPPAASSK